MEFNRPKMNYCTNCVACASSAVPLAFDENGLCSGCRTGLQREDVDWARRGKLFRQLLDQYHNRDGSNYDCIIPVSGGKDSWYQIHTVKNVFGMNPLLVTYHGNNYTSTGMKNLIKMREVFHCDHDFFTPSIDVLAKMNRIGFKLMGDMNWHAHAGIFTYPIRVAVQQKIPLMIWGEHGFMDLGGMHSYNDFVEFTFRYRHEHCLRGYEWFDFTDEGLEKLGRADLKEGLTAKHLLPWMYPTDAEIEKTEVRGIYMSNYVRWEANDHGQQMVEMGFLPAEEPFERTYRTLSNLDDMHENGIHDYMKFVKFGYGRATDHVCKDIRAGKITRDDGIKIVLERDPIKSKDLYRWLKYVDMTENRFDEIADTFRDPRVWWIENGLWWKDTLLGKPSSFGTVHLSEGLWKKYIR